MMMHLIDDEDTALLESARVSQRYAGHGLMTRLVDLVFNDFEKTHTFRRVSMIAKNPPSFMVNIITSFQDETVYICEFGNTYYRFLSVYILKHNVYTLERLCHDQQMNSKI